ncbi:cytochrome P450 [Actinomadura sp. NPDC000929]|uniref:cytochrome P450 n=1 Tax=Actinomadura sp. NPDC000929 TaxID=3154517 RepID=UPI0033977C7C
MSEAPVADPAAGLAEPAALLDPYSLFGRLRESAPVYRSTFLDSWVMTRYDDCAAVLRDTESFASDWRRIGEAVPEPLLSIQSLDPPEHTAIRHFMVDAVRGLDPGTLRERIAAQVRARAERLRAAGEFDCVSDLTAPLALDTITAVLGVPPIDAAWFLPVSQTVVDGMDAGIWPETAEPAVRARAELAEYTGRWLDDPPADGLVAHVAAKAPGSGIARPVLLNTLRAVLHAGFESAGRLLSNALVVLLSGPDTLARFARADPSLAVEELVRYVTPVQADGRACVRETRVGGHVVAPGEAVTLLLAAANRDPAKFAEPDELDFGRHPNPHLGFGRGTHSCLGQSLAVLQAQVVLGLLATEFPGIRLAGEPVYHRNLTLRGVARLRVRLG